MMDHLERLKAEEMPDYDLLKVDQAPLRLNKQQKHLESEYTAKGNADWTTPPEYIQLLKSFYAAEETNEKV